MLKDDLVDGLAAHLRTNSTKLSRNAAFDEFYSRTTRSPIKKERGSPVLPSDTADLDSRTPKPRRRNTKAPTDFEYVAPYMSRTLQRHHDSKFGG